MKQIVIVLLIVLNSAINGFGQDNNFILNGVIDRKYNDQQIMLFKFKNDTINSVDTTTVTNGRFSFLGEEYLDDFSMLAIGNYPDTVLSTEVVLEKGVIDVELKADKSIIKGPFLNELYRMYHDITDLFFQKLETHKPTNPSLMGKQGTPYFEWFRQLGYFQVNFKKNNINNIVGKKLFIEELNRTFAEDYAYGFNTDSAFYLIYNAAPDDIKSDPEIVRNIKSLAKNKEENSKRSKMEGKPYIDFKFQTPDGQEKKISDYVGKSEYLYIDFWASWCGPCIAEMPRLKELYEKYKDRGFNILGISLDSSKASWHGGLKRIDVPWDNLSDLEGFDSELTKTYAIMGIPYGLLLDKEGTILAVNLASPILNEVLDQWLK